MIALTRVPGELPSKDQIHEELKELVDHLTVQQVPLVLSHNDLWLGNILVNRETGQSCIALSEL